MGSVSYSDTARAGIRKLRLSRVRAAGLQYKIEFQIFRFPELTAVRHSGFPGRDVRVDEVYLGRRVRIVVEFVRDDMIVWSVGWKK